MCYSHTSGSSSQDVVWTVNCAKMLYDDSFQNSAYHLPHMSFRNKQSKRLCSAFSIYNQNTQIQSCLRWRQGSLGWGWVSWGYTDSDKNCLWFSSLWVFISSTVKCVTSEHTDEFRFKCLWNKPLVCLYSTLEFVFKNPFNSLHTTFTTFFFQALLANKHKTIRNLRTRKHDF